MATLGELKSRAKTGIDTDVIARGGYGMRVLTSSDNGESGDYYGLLIVKSDCDLTFVNELGGDDFTSASVVAGDEIWGLFEQSNITVGSGGTIWAYLANDE